MNVRTTRITLALTAAVAVTLPAGVRAAGQAVYTALGDSIAFGAFAPIGRGYVPLYAKGLANDTGASVSLYNLGVPGWTSQDLRNALDTKFVFRLSVFASNVVTFNIGGNDLSAARNRYKAQTCGGATNEDCLGAAVLAVENNWDGILSAVLKLRKSRPTVIRTMTIYNPFVNEDKASDSWPPGGDGTSDFTILKPYLDILNAYIATASLTKGVLIADVYHVFNGPSGDEDPADKGLLAFDDFHPNANGHAVMTTLLRNLGYATVTP